MYKIEDPFENINKSLDQIPHINISPIHNLDNSYSLILPYDALSEINKGLKFLFKKRENSRKVTNYSARMTEFELTPIFDMNGICTITVSEQELKQIINGMNLLQNNRVKAKERARKTATEKKQRLLEEQETDQYNYENTIIKQNHVKLKIISM